MGRLHRGGVDIVEVELLTDIKTSMEHNFDLLEGVAQRIVLRFVAPGGEPLAAEGYEVAGGAWLPGHPAVYFGVEPLEDGVLLLVPGLCAAGLAWQYAVSVRERATDVVWTVLRGEICVERDLSGATGTAAMDMEAVVCLNADTLELDVALGDSTVICLNEAAAARAARAAAEASVQEAAAYFERMQELALGTKGEQGEPGAYYIPYVSTSGLLAWNKSDPSLPSITSRDIRGPKGSTGPQGEPGPPGPQGEPGVVTKEAIEAVLPIEYTNTHAVMFGENSLAVNGGVSIGRDGGSIGAEDVNIGYQARAGGSGACVTIGSHAESEGGNNVTIGTYSKTSYFYDIAIGPYADARQASAIAIGNRATALSSYSIAIGQGARVGGLFDNAVAIGRGAQVKTAGQLLLSSYDSSGASLRLELLPGEATGLDGDMQADNPFVYGAKFIISVKDHLDGRVESCVFDVGKLFKFLEANGATIENYTEEVYGYGS